MGCCAVRKVAERSSEGVRSAGRFWDLAHSSRRHQNLWEFVESDAKGWSWEKRIVGGLNSYPWYSLYSRLKRGGKETDTFLIAGLRRRGADRGLPDPSACARIRPEGIPLCGWFQRQAQRTPVQYGCLIRESVQSKVPDGSSRAHSPDLLCGYELWGTPEKRLVVSTKGSLINYTSIDPR